jgi:hypothetical protein
MNRRRDWLAGLVFGVWAGLLLIYGLVAGVLLVLGFVILAAIDRSRIAFGGLFVGGGAALLLIVALVNLNCAGLYGLDDGGCVPPDLTGWPVTGSVIAMAGVVLTVVIVIRYGRLARTRRL